MVEGTENRWRHAPKGGLPQKVTGRMPLETETLSSVEGCVDRKVAPVLTTVEIVD